MKKLFSLIVSVFMLAFAYGTTNTLFGDPMLSASVTIGLGVFSAIMYKMPVLSNSLFSAILIPDFTPKSQAEIDAMDSTQMGIYLKEKGEFEIATLKSQLAALGEDKSKNADELKRLETSINAMMKQVENQILTLKALEEKGMNPEIKKSELIEFIEKRAALDFNDKGRKENNTVQLKAAALMTTANVIPNVTNGFNQLFGNYIDPNIHSAPKESPFIMSLVDVTTQEGTEDIWYVQRINEEGDAAFIAEGALKPLADGEWKEFKTSVKEVAVRWKMSRRMLKNAAMAVSNFRTHVNELIELKMDNGVLSGPGTGNELSGVTTLAAPFVVPAQLANYYQDANIYDVIMAVATYVRLNNFKGNLTCVLNSVWEAKMKGIKNLDGDYIIPPFVSPDGTKVGSVTMRFENGMSEDDILLGDLKQFKAVISSNIEYFEGFSDDDFDKNLESRKLEAFLGTYLPSTKAGSIIFDDIATILTAIEAT